MIKPTDTWLTNQELFEETDFYKKLHDDPYIKIRDEKDQPKPKVSWKHAILSIMYGIHLTNIQTQVYKKLK